MATARNTARQDGGLEKIALRSDNALKRATDVFCVLLLQLLSLMVLAAEPDPEKRQTHSVLASTSLLSRFDDGDTFDLPPPIIAWLRLMVRLIRAQSAVKLDRSLLVAQTPASRRPARSAPRRARKAGNIARYHPPAPIIPWHRPGQAAQAAIIAASAPRPAARPPPSRPTEKPAALDHNRHTLIVTIS